MKKGGGQPPLNLLSIGIPLPSEAISMASTSTFQGPMKKFLSSQLCGSVHSSNMIIIIYNEVVGGA
jgi:hypothetical protein